MNFFKKRIHRFVWGINVHLYISRKKGNLLFFSLMIFWNANNGSVFCQRLEIIFRRCSTLCGTLKLELWSVILPTLQNPYCILLSFCMKVSMMKWWENWLKRIPRSELEIPGMVRAHLVLAKYGDSWWEKSTYQTGGRDSESGVSCPGLYHFWTLPETSLSGIFSFPL